MSFGHPAGNEKGFRKERRKRIPERETKKGSGKRKNEEKRIYAKPPFGKDDQ